MNLNHIIKLLGNKEIRFLYLLLTNLVTDLILDTNTSNINILIFLFGKNKNLFCMAINQSISRLLLNLFVGILI